jgi:biopolymer transport protein ExbB
MKYLHTLVTTTLLLPFLPLSAENAEAEGSPPASAAIYAAQEEEASLSSLEEELSLLDEEFEEFKEELFSLENDLQNKEPAVKEVLNTSENPSTAEPISAPAAAQSNVEAPMLLTAPLTSKEETAPTLEFIPVSVVENAAVPVQKTLTEEKVSQDSPAILNVEGTAFVGEAAPMNDAIAVDLNQAFSGSPIIYSILFAMSVVAVCIWLYSILSLRNSVSLSGSVLKKVQNKLNSNHFEEALSICTEHNNLFCKMVASGIQSRRHGLPMMVEAMKAEGKRASTSFWQKLSLLNDIAIIAPMIGLLGTVLGMFYAFYDINRSIESISTLFDGLGISVGTTVAGLIVAILALILHSTAKYRLVRALAQVENEAQHIANLIDDRTSISKG